MAKIQITYFNFDQNSIQVSNFTLVNFLITPKKKKKIIHLSCGWDENGGPITQKAERDKPIPKIIWGSLFRGCFGLRQAHFNEEYKGTSWGEELHLGEIPTRTYTS